ncbi:pyridoxamine 5'-phosphate oxidase family protein [Nocardia cyriacigeorgica]|uniref:pyridoxamine 5'-phosphate oxidase family protein n=1 Tax=Nocardia cyriacigeorgica TaxID=135487 RepID=UPI0013D77D78|nr:pyridoxamine 5'-phosphate oxidase family protein [Nocardia cyriacigeorgica]MBF6435025.1 pyridoxamine 5'-phosphate oxidase family protein [Nocardia cyriacigeorgica]NEW28998.1 pyridoxamine 5-phosphate oxidase [Nocardia cyriacigeorgica]
MPLTSVEREQFLAQPQLASLAVAGLDGRGPLTVPIWYQYSPGGELWVITGAESQKLTHIRAAGRFSLVAQRLEPTVRYVSVEGPVTRIASMTEEHSREMATRFLPAENVEGYLRVSAQFGEQVVVFMRPEHWLSADMGDTSQL